MTEQMTPADHDYWEQIEGTPFPLGASLVEGEKALNFALFSQHAEAVTLLLFGDKDLTAPCYCYVLDRLKNKSGPVWHCRVPLAQARTVKYYGFQVAGPAPQDGILLHDFDPAKLLLDPYAKAVHFPDQFSREAACQPGSNMGRAPLGMLEACVVDIESEVAVERGQSGHIIYELHVRGFTRDPSSGLIEAKPRHVRRPGRKDSVPRRTRNHRRRVDADLSARSRRSNNYWGYMPLNFFSPNQGYSCTPASLQPARRIPRHGRRASPRRHRSHSGRRLQPYLRRRRTRTLL